MLALLTSLVDLLLLEGHLKFFLVFLGYYMMCQLIADRLDTVLAIDPDKHRRLLPCCLPKILAQS